MAEEIEKTTYKRRTNIRQEITANAVLNGEKIKVDSKYEQEKNEQKLDIFFNELIIEFKTSMTKGVPEITLHTYHLNRNSMGQEIEINTVLSELIRILKPAYDNEARKYMEEIESKFCLEQGINCNVNHNSKTEDNFEIKYAKKDESIETLIVTYKKLDEGEGIKETLTVKLATPSEQALHFSGKIAQFKRGYTSSEKGIRELEGLWLSADEDFAKYFQKNIVPILNEKLPLDMQLYNQE